jgi:DNA-binding NarL/FixJ family response regulator
MNILVADDHAVVRRGIREILADAFPGTVFSEAGNGEDVLRLLGQAEFSILMLDINMPGRSGLDVLRDVKRTYKRLPVIMLSVQPEDQYAMRCLRAGAAAYINKDSAPEELEKATRKVLGGGRYISSGFAEKLCAMLDEPVAQPPHELLSDREHEVMRMIVTGLPLKAIAERLHVSVKTVSTYRTRIMEKMQMKSNAELTRYALREKIID